MTADPAISVIVVRHRDDPRIESCLAALAGQQGVALEVVVVENASSPAGGAGAEPWRAPAGAIVSLDWVTRQANPGFAVSFNEAWARTRGEVVLSVNPDCRLDPHAAAEARAILAADPTAGAVAFRLLRPGRELLDSAGIRLSPVLLRAADRGRGGPAAGEFVLPERVDAACLAGAAFRRDAVERSRDGAGEVLDSRYFAYQEDVDLGWRMRRAGFAILYDPRPVGEHDRGWREGMRRRIPVALRRLSLRNRWFTILKNASWAGVLWRFPFLCLFEACFFAKLLATEPQVVPAWGMAARGARECVARRKLAHDRRDRERR